MGKNPEYSITIDAPIEKVWETLSNFESYSEWNDLLSFNGTPQVGESTPMRVKIFNRDTTVPVAFLKIDKEKEVRWIGGIPKLITGEHYFKIMKLSGDQTQLIQGETFNGMLLGLVWPLVKGTLDDLYKNSNLRIKERAESL